MLSRALTTLGVVPDESPERPESPPVRWPPRWIVAVVVVFWIGWLGSGVAVDVWHRISGLVLLLVISLFLALAIEPGVNRLAQRGWRRGRATATIIFGVILAVGVFIGAMGTLIGTQIADLLAYLETVSDPNFVEPAPKTIPAKLPGVTREPEEADSTFYSPEESMKRIYLAPGYRLELVASEPMIEEPVLCVWDGNSRMYVAEMRTYMQDADGTDQDLPKSRVSMLEDTDGDGKMDKVSRFADNMVLPRMILPLDDRIIINETYTNDYYSYRDTDGDGVADEKELLYGGGKAGGNLEHQNSGLTWGIDNWIYTARTGDQRHRFIGGKWTSERLYSDNGQWGLAMDDVGRFFLSAAGGEKPAYGFQQLPHYGKLSLPGEREPDFEAWLAEREHS